MSAPSVYTIVYTADLIRSFNTSLSPPHRSTRKTLFSLGLWRPAYLRSLPCPSSASSRSEPCSEPCRPPPSPSSAIRLATLNVRSLKHKYVPTADMIMANDLDVLVVSESWHVSSSDVAVRRAAPPGFQFIDRPRAEDTGDDVGGGGLIVYHRSELRAKRIELARTPSTFEALAVSLSSKRGPTTLLAIYRPGSSPPPSAFFEELLALLEQFALHNAQLVLTGDLNLHLEDSSLSQSMDFAAVMEQFGLKQHVTEPTHLLGGWLDVIVTRDDCQVSDVTVFPPVLSDHGLVVASIPFIYEPLLLTVRQIRNWKSLDRSAFRSALRAHPLFADLQSSTGQSTSELFSSYETALSGLLDTFLPVRNVQSRYRSSSPWFDAECRKLRRQARRLERIWIRTRSPADRASWIRFVRDMHTSYRAREREYWETIITRQSKEPKRLWTTFNSLLGRSKGGRQSESPPPFSAEVFLQRFSAKISSIRSSTAESPSPTFSTTEHRLPTLQEITSEELRRLILSSAAKTCELDPVPTFLVQELIDDLLPFLTILCNSSIREMCLPASQKRSVLLPILKRDGSDHGFHVVTMGLYMDQLVRRVDPQHRRLDQFFAEEVSRKFGIDCFIGLPKEEYHRCARLQLLSPSAFLSNMFKPLRAWVCEREIDTDEKLKKSLDNIVERDKVCECDDIPAFCAIPCASTHGFATVTAVAKLYSILANGGRHEKQTLLSSPVVKKLNEPLVSGVDAVCCLDSTFGRGTVIMRSKDGHNIFGHPGFGGQAGFADPKHRLGWAYMTNSPVFFLYADDWRYNELIRTMYETVRKLE